MLRLHRRKPFKFVSCALLCLIPTTYKDGSGVPINGLRGRKTFANIHRSSRIPLQVAPTWLASFSGHYSSACSLRLLASSRSGKTDANTKQEVCKSMSINVERHHADRPHKAQSRGVYTTVAWTESERRSYFTVSRDANATRESSWVIWGWYRARFGARMYSIRSGDYETTAARAGGGYAVELCP